MRATDAHGSVRRVVFLFLLNPKGKKKTKRGTRIFVPRVLFDYAFRSRDVVTIGTQELEPLPELGLATRSIDGFGTGWQIFFPRRSAVGRRVRAQTDGRSAAARSRARVFRPDNFDLWYLLCILFLGN